CDQVTACLRELAERLGPPLAHGDMVLVLWGDCTIAPAVIAALRPLRTAPQSTIDGALDWMGLAHALSLPGCVDVLADTFGPRPLLEPNQVAWLGVEPRMATDWEREQASRLGLRVTSSEALAADPAAAASEALGY